MSTNLRKPIFTVPTLLTLLYIVVISVAFLFSFTNYRAIEQRIPKDYSYYAQFFSKVYDDKFESQFSPLTGICMHGHNIFFMDGCDGAKNMNRSLHFEPIKYLIALLYSLFGSLIPILVFYILIFYSPLLYAAKIISDKK